MQTSGQKTSILAFLLWLLSFSGITRHDVSEDEYIQLAQQVQFDCVGRLTNVDSTVSKGSGVLITQSHVLTAAHILVKGQSRTDTTKTGDNKTVIKRIRLKSEVLEADNVLFEIAGKKFLAKQITVHPSYLDSPTSDFCDMAIVELESPVTQVEPAKLNTRLDELSSTVVGVGFGASGPADKPELVSLHNKKIAGENVVDSIVGKKYLGNPTLMMCDFDHPTNSKCNKIGSAIPQPLEYISAGGDSGGGLFREANGEWELIGVCKGISININELIKNGYYGQIMEWTRVSIFHDWIEEVISER